MCLSTVTRILAFCLVCLSIAVIPGCGDGGNGTEEAVQVPNSTLQGNVAQVMAALHPQPSQPSYLARWHEFFRLVPTAHAQTANLAGILVVARQGSTTVDTATTDANGSFTLRVAGGTVTLVFTTATYTVSTDLTIPANTTVLLVVILEPTRVVVPTQVVVAEGALSPIRCTGGTVRLPAAVQLPAAAPSDIVIDGRGEDCLRAEGRCTIDLALDVRSLTLTNCERCIRAAGNAEVLLSTQGSLRCTASEDGILAEGTASVTLEAGNLNIAAGEHGIRAAGTADVVLDVPTCMINGTQGPTRIDGNATIDGCGL